MHAQASVAEVLGATASAVRTWTADELKMREDMARIACSKGRRSIFEQTLLGRRTDIFPQTVRAESSWPTGSVPLPELRKKKKEGGCWSGDTSSVVRNLSSGPRARTVRPSRVAGV